VTHGTNRLCAAPNPFEHVTRILANDAPSGPTIDLWDGQTSERAVRAIEHILA
jgi:hypothetical protein